MPVESSSSSDMAESSSSSLSSPSSSKPKLVKSMSERQQILAEDAAKIFDDTISAGKKVQPSILNVCILNYLFCFFNVCIFCS